MALSLKDLNRPVLALVVVGNVALYLGLLFELDSKEVSRLIRNYETYLPATLAAVFAGVLNSQVDPTLKARLVFWRWANPLPGSYAFTRHMNNDPRIDPESLKSLVDPLPTDPVEQNRLWFKWYREFQDDPGISQVHREYLLGRDWASLTVLLTIVLVPIGLYQMDSGSMLILICVLVAQYLLVKRSAKNHGERFVSTVLAYKSSSNLV